MKTIIAPVYLHEELKIKLLQENEQNYLLDYQFIDFNSFIKKYLEIGDDSFLKAVKILKQVDVKILKKMLKYPKFLEDIYNFYNKSLKNNLNLNNFPCKNESYFELKELITSLDSLNLTNSSYKKLQELFRDDFSTCYLYDINLGLEDWTLINHLQSLGLNIIKYDQNSNHQIAYNTLNKHQEIEAIAQEIITLDLPLDQINIISCNPDYLPLIKQVFAIYNLPYGSTSNNLVNDANHKFKQLIKLYLQPNIENYRQATILNCFLKKGNQEINLYLRDYLNDLSELNREFNYYQNLEVNIDKRDLQSLIELEKKANQVHLENLASFKLIINSKNLKEAIVNAFEIVKKNSDIKQVKILKRNIEKYYDEIDENNLDFFLHTLKDTYLDYQSYQNKICVTNLENKVFARDYSFLIGADQNHFPNFTIEKGYFNQKVLEEINYFSQADLYQHYLDQIQWIYHSAKQKLYFFSSIAKYDGKAIENSLELERLVKFTEYPLLSNDYYYLKGHQLKKENALQIFTKDQTIYGSVSSFEKYFNCPYSYFLNYGLKLYDNSLIDIQANTLGTVAHSIFENLCLKYGKNYAKRSYEELLLESNKQFNELKKIFRNRELELDSIQERFVKDLSQGFAFYQSMEKASKFNPEFLEKEVQAIMAQKDNYQLKVKGYIDRVDSYGSQFRIIDYKSSSKTLSATRIGQGLQLQLPTYTYIIKNQENMNPAGSYYSNYLAKKEKFNDYSYSISKQLQAVDYRILIDDLIKKQRLSGFTYELSLDLDDGNHIKNLNNKKELKITGGNDHYENLESGILAIYSHLLSNLLIGNIKLDPVKGACTYCNYQSICNFKGRVKEFNDTIIDINIKNKEGNNE